MSPFPSSVRRHRWKTHFPTIAEFVSGIKPDRARYGFSIPVVDAFSVTSPLLKTELQLTLKSDYWYKPLVMKSRSIWNPSLAANVMAVFEQKELSHGQQMDLLCRLSDDSFDLRG